MIGCNGEVERYTVCVCLSAELYVASPQKQQMKMISRTISLIWLDNPSLKVK